MSQDYGSVPGKSLARDPKHNGSSLIISVKVLLPPGCNEKLHLHDA